MEQIAVQIPKSVDKTQLITFLSSQTLGSYDLIWAFDPVDEQPTVGLRFTRSERPPGAYYRDPYPVTVQVLASRLPELPVVQLPLDVTEFLAALQ